MPERNDGSLPFKLFNPPVRVLPDAPADLLSLLTALRKRSLILVVDCPHILIWPWADCVMDFFFGRANQKERRTLRRAVWAEESEEDTWVDTLLNLADRRNTGVDDSNLAQTKAKDQQGDMIAGSDIPKIIHFIWLGGNPLPRFTSLLKEGEDRGDDLPGNLSNACIESWRTYHSGWRFQIWTEADVIMEGCKLSKTSTERFEIHASQMCNSSAYLHAIEFGNYGLASDVLRLEILAIFGGVYVDIDYLCVSPLHDLVNPTRLPLHFFCGASNTGCVELNNGIMACKEGGHQILSNMMRSIRHYFERRSERHAAMEKVKSFLGEEIQLDELSPMEVIANTGPGLLTRELCRWLVSEDTGPPGLSKGVAVYPAVVFHPFPNNLRSSVANECNFEEFIEKDTIAVHLWGSSWQK